MFTGTNTTGVFGRMGGSPERQEEMENEASKYAVVEAVLKVYDENARLRIENARLRIENERLKRLNDDIATIAAPTECESDPYAYAEARIMEEGRKNLVDKAIKYWPDVTVRRDDSGLIVVEKFEKWRKDNVGDVPDFMSREDFYKLMDTEIRAVYEKEKRKAMDALAEAERENDDE